MKIRRLKNVALSVLLLMLLFIINTRFSIKAQCLTDFTKLLPDPSIDNTLGFGSSVSMYDDYLAVGVPNSDCLGRLTGIVYIYQKQGTQWSKIASMIPNVSGDALQFGSTVKLSKNYLLVGATGNGGKVYLFKKSISGWESSSELTTFSISNSKVFGCGINHAIAISDDEQTIAITDFLFPSTSQPNRTWGAIFVYHKLPSSEWTSALIPTQIIPSTADTGDFGRSGVHIQGDRIITGTPFTNSGIGNIFVYRNNAGSLWNSFVLEAELNPGASANSLFFTYFTIALTHEGIFTTINSPNGSAREFKIAFFKKPTSGLWANSEPTCTFSFINNSSINPTNKHFLTSNGNELYVSFVDKQNIGKVVKIKEGVSGWCAPEYTLIDSVSPTPFQSQVNQQLNFGILNACNQDDNIIVSYTSHPESNFDQIAMKVYSKEVSGWISQLIYSTKKSSSFHRFGSKLLVRNELLFVSAPLDGSAKSNAGVVYCYKKESSGWTETSKILPTIKNNYDDVFGSGLAFNGEQLAIGASGFEPKGKVFIFDKSGSDWSSPVLSQEIELPSQLNVNNFGDNLAMNTEWLIIPFSNVGNFLISIAIYKLVNGEWIYFQHIDTDYFTFGAKLGSSAAVDIKENLILFGGEIIELTSLGKWERRYKLMPSDPENIQILPDFSGYVTDGSMFGSTGEFVNENTIIIGAPGKDHEGTWNVGAVYIYTKKPGETWSSREESGKILPRIKEENELFGYSLSSSYNSLIVGAPGADFSKYGAARNKPGRAYVYQAEDYFWKAVTPLLDFTGDTNKKDYFGIAVAFDNSDFVIAAPTEDTPSGNLSGSVYLTPAPPVIKLVPPVCITDGIVDLFGYPFGGTWAGPGIIDPTKGTFDPVMVGVGTHEFNYSTPSCTYLGKLRITVEAPPIVQLLTPVNNIVCENQIFSKTLKVAPQPSCNYLWFYRENAGTQFTSLDNRGAEMSATKRGQYQVKVYNSTCAVFSPVITIENEYINFVLSHQQRVCSNSTLVIGLSANPAGGKWSGIAVTGNQFFPGIASAGKHVLTYEYVSSNTCNFLTPTTIEVYKPFEPVINRVSGNLCTTGVVEIQLEVNSPDDYTLLWNSKDSSSNTYSTIQMNGTSLTTTIHGSFKIIASNDVCKSESNSLVIDDHFIPAINPDKPEVTVCSDDVFSIAITPESGTTYDWFYSDSPTNNPIQLSEHESELFIRKSGYYKTIVHRGVCSFVSAYKHIQILETDSVFAPNVFTPNEDGINDYFQIITKKQDVNYIVLNRYGERVFHGNVNTPWTGDDASPGIYFWSVVFADCHGNRKTFKGYVHLMR